MGALDTRKRTAHGRGDNCSVEGMFGEEVLKSREMGPLNEMMTMEKPCWELRMKWEIRLVR